MTRFSNRPIQHAVRTEFTTTPSPPLQKGGQGGLNQPGTLT
jgi:hypothetical protein